MAWAGIATSTRAAALKDEERLSMELDAVERLVGGRGEVGLWEVGSGSNLDWLIRPCNFIFKALYYNFLII
jgi:hypothetical protein